MDEISHSRLTSMAEPGPDAGTRNAVSMAYRKSQSSRTGRKSLGGVRSGGGEDGALKAGGETKPKGRMAAEVGGSDQSRDLERLKRVSAWRDGMTGIGKVERKSRPGACCSASRVTGGNTSRMHRGIRTQQTVEPCPAR